MIFNSPERVAALTPKSTFPRMADGRPEVPADLLERVKLVTNDEAYNIIERENGYKYQFAGNWFRTAPDVVLVGRVVTAMMLPMRPDLNEVVQADGTSEGRSGWQNTWVIDSLQPGDVLVVDMQGKVRDGTFIGDNLATATRSRTGTGIIIDGGIRDYQRIAEMTDFGVFCRGVDPTAIAECTLVGVNIPIKIGPATVLPGDVVLGTATGVTFIPPHLCEQVVNYSENVRQRDVFGKQRLAERTYTSGQIDVGVWEKGIEDDYRGWCETNKVPYKPQ